MNERFGIENFKTEILFIVIINLIFVAFLHFGKYKNEMKNVSEDLKVLVKNYEGEISDSVNYLNKKKLEKILNIMITNPLVENIAVYNNKNELFVEMLNRKIKMNYEEVIKSRFIINRKKSEEIKTVASLIIDTKKRLILSNIKKDLYLNIVFSITISIAIFSTLYFNVKKMFFIPIRHLLKETGKITFKNLNNLNSLSKLNNINGLLELEKNINNIISEFRNAKDSWVQTIEENLHMNVKLTELNSQLESKLDILDETNEKVIQLNKDLKLKNMQIDEDNKQFIQLNKDLKLKNMQIDEDNKQVRVLLNQVENFNENLEEIVAEKTSEVQGLLNNIKLSILSVGKNFEVVLPFSSYSKSFFGRDVLGVNIFNLIYSNFKKGTREYEELVHNWPKCFSISEKESFSEKYNLLPKKVTLPDQMTKKGKTLKLSYAPIYEKDNSISKIMIIAEDITENEKSLVEIEDDALSFSFVKEIMSIDEKPLLEEKMIKAINLILDVLEDFVSPLSDTYHKAYFDAELSKIFSLLKESFTSNPILIKKTNDVFTYLKSDDMESINKLNKRMNHQYDASNKVCALLDVYIKYGAVFNLFYPFDFKFDKSFYEKILEKVENLKKVFKNLFEYVFLVREVYKIDQEELDRVSRVAMLYPDFERTISLIHQRSKLISFLLNVINAKKESEVYEDLSILIKQMPDKIKMDSIILKNNLVEPYKNVLEIDEDVRKLLEKFLVETS
tara:strand:+ start:1614 stop:3806 length:2193 start_codon:yes stop_codon:yes gene_type:complete